VLISHTGRLSRHGEQSWMAKGFVLLIAAIAATSTIALNPGRGLSICVLVFSALIVLLEPRSAFVLIPVSVPFGSVVPLSLGSAAITPTDAMVASLLLAWMLTAGSRPAVRWKAWGVAALALLAVMVLSTSQAISIVSSLREIVKWLELLVLVCLTPVYLRRKSDVIPVLVAAALAATTEALVGIGQSLLHMGPASFQIYGRFLRAYGTFGQPNPLSGYLNLMFAIAVGAWVALRRPMFLMAAGACALGTLLTFSRAGWAAWTVSAAVMLLLRVRPLRSWAGLTGVALLVLGLLLSFSVIPFSPFRRLAASFGITAVNFHHYSHRNFSEVERAAHWLAGVRMFAAHPLLGVGIGNYPEAYGRYHVGAFVDPLGHAHNYFINIAAETGLLGLFAYTLFVTAGFWLAWRSFFHGRSPLSLGVAIGLVGVWVSSTFHNLFDVLYVHEIPALLGLLMGLLIAAVAIDEADAANTTRYHTTDLEPRHPHLSSTRLGATES